MKRNPNATCGTCPYWHQNPKSTCGKCRLNPEAVEKLDTEWCSQHPDFWEAEAEAEPDMTDREPPALDEIARLLNDNEHSEALKELRRMHGLVDRFVCTNCGNISSSTGPGFACRECGGHLTARVVVAQPTPELPALQDEIERLRARVKELEAEVESSRRADVAINRALNEGDGSYRP